MNMRKKSHKNDGGNWISRRRFFKIGSVALAGSTVTPFRLKNPPKIPDGSENSGKIKAFRTLGRTGFQVSDISLGGLIREAGLVRYAYDKGINYIDTAENYLNGLAETKIGEAMPHMDRKKIFITTKLILSTVDSKESVLDRFRKCQERLRTEYVDALFNHAVNQIDVLNHSGFHAAADQLKQEGRIKHIGVSCHGSGGQGGESMGKILTAAAEDGRFDLMLLVYNFMNREVGENVLAACRKNNIGTSAMKTCPGTIKVDPLDPDNLTEQQAAYLDRLMKRGRSREKALERIQRSLTHQRKNVEKTKPFADKYGIQTQDELRKVSVQWVLQNRDMHTVCIGMNDFDLIDFFIPLSGTTLSQAGQRFLKAFQWAYDNQYCRHGCNACAEACPHDVPVSTIMRYAYYFDNQGREREAMRKYASLKGHNVEWCASCDAPCNQACPYKLEVQAQLFQAHMLLAWT
jgi:predicted aldo/keto reductase-like oxidoreductase